MYIVAVQPEFLQWLQVGGFSCKCATGGFAGMQQQLDSNSIDNQPWSAYT
jgi:hypothetical protein